MLAYVQVLL